MIVHADSCGGHPIWLAFDPDGLVTVDFGPNLSDAECMTSLEGASNAL